MILGTITRKANKNGDSDEDYLGDRITFSEDKLMDSNSKAIMMAWEKPLMEAHAKAICSGGGHILNIGFGMGLVDTAIQQYKPATHTIIEAHPEVYNRMLHTGWGEKDNVQMIFGRWQDVLPQLESYDGNSIFSCSPIHIQYVSWCFYLLLLYKDISMSIFYFLFIFLFFKVHTLGCHCEGSLLTSS